MLYIQKGEEPEFLTEFKRKNPAKQYDSKEFKSWIPILRDVLCNEQKGLCAYCCSKISVDKFSYFANGEIVGDEYTINLLGLNHYDLKSARQAVYKMLQGMDKETIAMVYMDENDVRMPYYDVLKWYYKHCC